MVENKISLIFVHKGYSFYLDYVLKQAYLFNQNADIYLLGDKDNNRYDFVCHEMIGDYFERADEFGTVYEHMSSNMYDYELFCFQRWFVVLEFVKRKGIVNFLCMDSDVLLYCNINSMFIKYVGCDFTICNGFHPAVNLFSASSLEKLCSFMMELYTVPSKLDRLRVRYKSFIMEKKVGGNCDMTAIQYYIEEFPHRVIDVGVPIDNFCFDGCISRSFDLFEMKNGLKKVYWINNKPYFKLLDDGMLVEVGSLHFVGKTKFVIYKYALDANLKYCNNLFFRMKGYLSYAIFKEKLKRYKRGISKLAHGNRIGTV